MSNNGSADTVAHDQALPQFSARHRRIVSKHVRDGVAICENARDLDEWLMVNSRSRLGPERLDRAMSDLAKLRTTINRVMSNIAEWTREIAALPDQARRENEAKFRTEYFEDLLRPYIARRTPTEFDEDQGPIDIFFLDCDYFKQSLEDVLVICLGLSFHRESDISLSAADLAPRQGCDPAKAEKSDSLSTSSSSTATVQVPCKSAIPARMPSDMSSAAESEKQLPTRSLNHTLPPDSTTLTGSQAAVISPGQTSQSIDLAKETAAVRTQFSSDVRSFPGRFPGQVSRSVSLTSDEEPIPETWTASRSLSSIDLISVLLPARAFPINDLINERDASKKILSKDTDESAEKERERQKDDNGGEYRGSEEENIPTIAPAPYPPLILDHSRSIPASLSSKRVQKTNSAPSHSHSSFPHPMSVISNSDETVEKEKGEERREMMSQCAGNRERGMKMADKVRMRPVNEGSEQDHFHPQAPNGCKQREGRSESATVKSIPYHLPDGEEMEKQRGESVLRRLDQDKQGNDGNEREQVAVTRQSIQSKTEDTVPLSPQPRLSPLSQPQEDYSSPHSHSIDPTRDIHAQREGSIPINAPGRTNSLNMEHSLCIVAWLILVHRAKIKSRQVDCSSSHPRPLGITANSKGTAERKKREEKEETFQGDQEKEPTRVQFEMLPINAEKNIPSGMSPTMAERQGENLTPTLTLTQHVISGPDLDKDRRKLLDLSLMVHTITETDSGHDDQKSRNVDTAQPNKGLDSLPSSVGKNIHLTEQVTTKLEPSSRISKIDRDIKVERSQSHKKNVEEMESSEIDSCKFRSTAESSTLPAHLTTYKQKDENRGIGKRTVKEQDTLRDQESKITLMINFLLIFCTRLLMILLPRLMSIPRARARCWGRSREIRDESDDIWSACHSLPPEGAERLSTARNDSNRRTGEMKELNSVPEERKGAMPYSEAWRGAGLTLSHSRILILGRIWRRTQMSRLLFSHLAVREYGHAPRPPNDSIQVTGEHSHSEEVVSTKHSLRPPESDTRIRYRENEDASMSGHIPRSLELSSQGFGRTSCSSSLRMNSSNTHGHSPRPTDPFSQETGVAPCSRPSTSPRHSPRPPDYHDQNYEDANLSKECLTGQISPLPEINTPSVGYSSRSVESSEFRVP